MTFRTLPAPPGSCGAVVRRDRHSSKWKENVDRSRTSATCKQTTASTVSVSCTGPWCSFSTGGYAAGVI